MKPRGTSPTGKIVGVALSRLVVRSATAWDSIGWDDGLFRIKGGRATYEAVMYNCANNGDKVKLAKLVLADGGIREVSRYVDPDTVLEFLSSHNVSAMAPPPQRLPSKKDVPGG